MPLNSNNNDDKWWRNKIKVQRQWVGDYHQLTDILGCQNVNIFWINYRVKQECRAKKQKQTLILEMKICSAGS